LRIAVNTLSVRPNTVGGGETYLTNLLDRMIPRLGPRESLVLLLSRGNRALFPFEGPRIRRVVLPISGTRRPLRLLFEHLALPAVLRLLDADVLLSPGNAVPLLAGVRHVLALQSMHYRLVGEEMARSRVLYFEKLVPLSALRSARVLCMSEDLRRELLSACPRAARRSVVVHEGADLRAFTPGERPPGTGEYLLYVSSLNPFKRPDSLVRALALLRREGFDPPPARLAGRPDPEDRDRVARLAKEEGVADLVEILGVVPHGELPDLYRGARTLVYPSAVETFGLPPLEAMACGCPVVASNRTSVPEVVGDAALLADPDDIPALAGAIRRVLTDDALRADLRRRGFRNLNRFSWESAAERTLETVRASAMLGSVSGRR
jgi:glycosyltransferase involved in cell wall biosynthesis